MAKKTTSRKKRASSRRGRRRRSTRWQFPWGKLLVFFLIIGAAYVAFLDLTVRRQFEGKRWELPARVYARPVELYAGLSLTANEFADELQRLRYQKVSDPQLAGEFSRAGNRFEMVTRSFVFPNGRGTERPLQVEFSEQSLVQVRDAETAREIDIARMEPGLIGSFYPSHKEDRILVRLRDVPVPLIDVLLAVEDRNFYNHIGVDIKAIARAMLANFKARRLVQGGSTLTQQLVKNLFLSNKRTLVRKLNEAIMAVLLEWHYTKDEILQAYMNEVYLGQEGSRAIHGFGLGSRFYFDRPPDQLELHQQALLMALVKGASYYDPRRHPTRALRRRNTVLDILAEQRLFSQAELDRARAKPLDVSKLRKNTVSRYPAFMDLVRRQLRSNYAEADLTSEGLRIFTTFEPRVQASLEKSVTAQLPALEKGRGLEAGSLEVASLVTTVEGGEISALIGGKRLRYAGFNRALDAMRPIGSVAKPAVYLTALNQHRKYNWLTQIDDSPLVFTARNGTDWKPENYSKEYHGKVTLLESLANSYNVSTARLGLLIGIRSVADTVRAMGVKARVNAFPSLALGAVDMTPIQVTQMYQTLANGGFRTPLRSIRAVLDKEGRALERYSLAVDQALDPRAVTLVNFGMQQVVKTGTARGLSKFLDPALNIAGKTGTTDDMRDSWFAGFSGDRLAVVWLGRDDNKPMKLTGASGAMQVWGSMMAGLRPAPLKLPQPEGVDRVWVNPVAMTRTDEACKGALHMPFIGDTAPQKYTRCTESLAPVKWIKKILQ